MSIFSKIKDAIFNFNPLGGQFGGKKPAPAPAPAPAAPTAPKVAPAPSAGSASAPVAPAPAPAQPVDIEANLTKMAADKGSDLNWRTSIVDLMKLLDLDSSLANRKELATELGYSGATDGSAEMNIWLHKAVMRELAKNGGKVPVGLTD